MSAALKSKDQFAARLFSEADGTTIHFSGIINENSSFDHLKIEAVKVLRLDLSEVTSINSMGIRRWVIWVKSLPRGVQVFLRKCPRSVVDQMNILKGFLPVGAVVESFSLPYSCPACNHEEEVMATRGRDFIEGTVDVVGGVNLPQQKPCPACAGQMEMDVIPAKYFAFLKYRS